MRFSLKFITRSRRASTPLRRLCLRGSDGEQKTSVNRDRFLDRTLEENKISGPVYVGAGRKAGRNATRGHQSRRWTQGLAEAAVGEDLLRHWAALEYGRLCRGDPGREREPIRRGGGDSAGRLGLLPRREAPRGGECRTRHCRSLLHGRRKHGPHPRRDAPRSRIQLVARRVYARGGEATPA